MIIWQYGGVNGSEIEVEPIFNNVATFIDRDSDILGREIQKRASGMVKQPIATNVGAQLQAPPRKIAQPAFQHEKNKQF
ncbi:unnamed protein product [Acanthocheilonema viteae]|uniref:Uncharacterized protein n=1 Tax=Acanthocheilonema viteae TaxID=6277 RepID=A0A498SSX4_ACAVI|nr:unnamed protein product [Acanthocheilonema viteae]